jgi:ABC-type nitrate/sulfonate/bicarbonate transport system substrate-binding protein
MPHLRTVAASMLRKTSPSTARPIRITVSRPANTLAVSRALRASKMYQPRPAALPDTGGTISGYAAPHPYSDIVEKSPSVHRLFFFSDYLGEKVTSGLLATTRAFMKKSPEIAEAIVGAIEEAGELIKADPRQAAEISLDAERPRSLSTKPSRC